MKCTVKATKILFGLHWQCRKCGKDNSYFIAKCKCKDREKTLNEACKNITGDEK